MHLNPNHADPRTAVHVVTKTFKDSEFFFTPQGRPAPLLENTITTQAMQFAQATAQTRFKVKVTWDLVLYNNETDEEMNFYDRRPTSPWFNNMTEARHWFEQVEEDRLQGHMQLPNTKFSYESTHAIEVKVLLSTQPLHYGAGKLPAWLRNKHGLHALDQQDDFLCLARCLAVHAGFNPKRCQREAKRYATQFEEAAGKHVCQASFKELEDFFQVNIAAYNVDDTRLFRLFYQAEARYPTTLLIGLYNDHAFYIKDLDQVAEAFVCPKCGKTATTSSNLLAHIRTCNKGETKLYCPNTRLYPPQTKYEEAFYPRDNHSVKEIAWLEYMQQRYGIHIHTSRCGHGGQRSIQVAEKEFIQVDGYHPESCTVFQFHGCYYHGCPTCYPSPKDRAKVIAKKNTKHPMTMQEKYEQTLANTATLRAAGYNVVEVWENHLGKIDKGNLPPISQNAIYPYCIVYDFEAYQDKTKEEHPTPDLFYESEHIPVSVAIADNFSNHTDYLVDTDPERLITRFYENIRDRATAIRQAVREQFPVPHPQSLAEEQRKRIQVWRDEVPILGYNCGRYDLKLIQRYFMKHCANERGLTEASKNGKIMFLKSGNYKFLDIMSYLAPGTTYDKWIKAYEAKQTKSWFPYEWFDSVAKLEYPGLPPFSEWYSKLKQAPVCTEAEYEECKRIFQERGFSTFGDWLEYYNRLDVEPFLLAATNMRDFYANLGVDIYKDAVSLPGVSLQYLMRKTLDNPATPPLFPPNLEAYKMLKGAVVGGPSLVFTRKHVVGETAIRSHGFPNSKLVKKILGYDANSLYPSTMQYEMPYGPGKVVTYDNPEEAAQALPMQIKTKQWFGFAEVDIEVPEEQWPKFEDFPPLFVNRAVPETAIPSHMKQYLRNSGRGIVPDQRKLLGGMSAKKILLYAPLLEW